GWHDNVSVLASGTDLFVTECYSGDRSVPNHIDWATLKRNVSTLDAKKIAVTHLGRSALACAREMTEEGLIVAEDGKVIDL
ncbi:MAG: MBL fold metallo-hydrolase, partial [Beijerinckiaceae bacterium]|nr:MBL fold metallo-hydrolase [Beijerinckiaceae bacterium]